ncbi:hypothetical protein AM228_02120 [Planktothricoides sp. SR001]|nr:hypothetical protein AM228_02120 [Planktothricoides sp. SR001]
MFLLTYIDQKFFLIKKYQKLNISIFRGSEVPKLIKFWEQKHQKMMAIASIAVGSFIIKPGFGEVGHHPQGGFPFILVL